MELAIGSKDCRHPARAHPNDVRSNIIIFREDETWSGNGAPISRLSRPLRKFDQQMRTNELMIQMRLLGHVEFPIDNLVSLSVVGKCVDIGCSKTRSRFYRYSFILSC